MTDMKDIHGHATAKRALEIAIVGGHSFVIEGPPGCGKSMLASAARAIDDDLFTAAQTGVIAIDKRDRNDWDLSERMMYPSTDADLRSITIEVKRGLEPYRKQQERLWATMRPCPCGYWQHTTIPCTCTPAAIIAYHTQQNYLTDMVSIHIYLSPPTWNELVSPPGENSAVITARILDVLKQQQAKQYTVRNDLLRNGDPLWQQRMQLDVPCKKLLQAAYTQNNLSVRTVYQASRVARTIADMDGEAWIQLHHLAEALQYTPKYPERSLG